MCLEISSMNRLFFCLLFCFVLNSVNPTSCSAWQTDPAWQAPSLEYAISVRDGRTGKVVNWNECLDDLARADAVFLGETHNDETTHRVELAVYEGMLKRRNSKVVLAMEMFERDVQQFLDQYLAGEIDEEEFLSKSRPWGNYRAAYRPLIEKAKQAGRKVVASNFPRPLRMELAKKGKAAIDDIDESRKDQVPGKLMPNSDVYRKRTDNAVRGHLAMMRAMGGDEDRLYSTQSLWDNSMGEACAMALEKNPGFQVVHVNGGFHTSYWEGTAKQLKVRRPATKIKTVSILPSLNPAVEELKGAAIADYVVFAESRASDINDGTWAVQTNRKIEYRLHVPPTASDTNRVPLLIWLVDDGLNSKDGLQLWKDRLGDRLAIAVIEPPYRELQEDLSEGGRWFWPGSFSSDIDSMKESVERVWGYVLRNYPVDPDNVVLAGEGTGGTVASAIGLLTKRINMDVVSILPRHYAKIKDFPLPLQEDWGNQVPPQRKLTIVGTKIHEGWWSEELKEYGQVGIESNLLPAADDLWKRELQLENVLRASTGLESRKYDKAGSGRFVFNVTDSPRSNHWARMLASKISTRDDESVIAVGELPETGRENRVPISIESKMFAKPHMAPKCPGPFGGTTVLVLPADTDANEIAGWQALEKDDPITKVSRFHRLRIATTDGDSDLPVVLKKLMSENRNNVLIVPAQFCAAPDVMRQLRRSVRDLGDQMTLQWLPGLGGQLSTE
ncbi:ChaN family lipoprotein [Vicingaceae bacterium]|nr:ChaN family lipoprotein [Vicingaceae bacterium]